MGRPHKKQHRKKPEATPLPEQRGPKRNHYYLAGLRRLRIDAWITQTELAKRAGMSTPMVSMLERMTQRGSPRTISKLAGALNVNPRELLTSRPLEELELKRMEQEDERTA